MVGKTLSQFRITARLGAGGMGEVYLAEDTRLKRKVAIKVLPEEMADDPQRLERFQREAEAIAALNHPNIVAIHEIGESDSVHFLVMELVDGRQLGEVIPSGGLALDKLFGYAIPLADALAAAHDKGILHRDLKPGNVMVNEEGRVKVLDFGLAKLRERSDDQGDQTHLATDSITQEGLILGTAAYMSPEQAEGKTIDHRSDIFSLGVVLYEMATGKRPFKGDTNLSLLSSILKDKPQPVSEVKTGLPRHLGRIILRGPTTTAPTPTAGKKMGLIAAGVALAVVALVVAFLLSRPPSTTPVEPGRPQIRSLAVLPLDNLTGDPEQEFFVDGMTEALITDLSKIGSLKVISRTSIMQYKDVQKPLPEIGRELNVDGIVEGSVQRAGDRVRISAQLVEAATDQHVWAESYERNFEDIFALQSEVAKAIAEEIQVTLSPEEETRLTTTRQIDPAAHEAYLKGRFFWNKRESEAVQRGLELFQQALEIDPSYAMAWVGVADSHIVASGDYLGLPAAEANDRARAAALRALELDESLAEAHISLAAVKMEGDWDLEGSEKEYQRGLELNPGYATGHQWYAELLSAMGRHEDSIAEMKKALELDPLSLIINASLGWRYFYAGRFEEALEQCLKTLEMEPLFVNGAWCAGQSLVGSGQVLEHPTDFSHYWEVCPLELRYRGLLVVAPGSAE
jgi:serine/threonine-protein kinase